MPGRGQGRGRKFHENPGALRSGNVLKRGGHGLKFALQPGDQGLRLRFGARGVSDLENAVIELGEIFNGQVKHPDIGVFQGLGGRTQVGIRGR